MHDSMDDMHSKFQPTGNATLTQSAPGEKIYKDDNFATKDTTTSCDKNGVCQVTECTNGKCMEYQKKQKKGDETPKDIKMTASNKTQSTGKPDVSKMPQDQKARSISFKKPDGTKGQKTAKNETPKAEIKT